MRLWHGGIIVLCQSCIIMAWINNQSAIVFCQCCIMVDWTWWHPQMETFSALLGLCAGNSPATCEFPTQRPVMWSFDVFFDLRLTEQLSNQSWGWWFEMPSCPLWCHNNDQSFKTHASTVLWSPVSVCHNLLQMLYHVAFPKGWHVYAKGSLVFHIECDASYSCIFSCIYWPDSYATYSLQVSVFPVIIFQ